LRYDQKTTDTARNRWLLLSVIALSSLVMLPGCSLGVMAGKMFFGDPKVKSQFRTATGTDLTKGEKSLLIVCSAPYGVLAKHPSIQIDIVDRMTRILDRKNVKVISSDDVAAWFDDHGEWGDFSELAEEFKADYVMHIQIETFKCEVPDSPNLLQGKADGKVKVLEAKDKNPPTMLMAFERTFDVTFPSYPVPRENKSEQLFTETFLERIAISLTHFVYDHRASETVH
jgi:ABC-type uncharacterized transport system auxiliary subunit